MIKNLVILVAALLATQNYVQAFGCKQKCKRTPPPVETVAVQKPVAQVLTQPTVVETRPHVAFQPQRPVFTFTRPSMTCSNGVCYTE